MSDATDIQAGLSSIEAQQRLQAEGWNELPSARPRSLLAIAWSVVREPMFILLIACGSIYLLLGSKEDAFILLGSVVIIMGMSFVQERKSERALEALRDLSSPRALVLRDGRQQRIAGRDVVRGDIILLAEGDRVPADALLFASQSMTLDESLLSGESVPVSKLASAVVTDQVAPPGGDDQPFLYSGTLVVQGKGTARVLATAGNTALGRIGQALSTLEAGAQPGADRDCAGGQAGRAVEHRSGDPAGGLVRHCARRLAQRHPGRADAGDGAVAGGIAADTDDFSGAGGVAHRPAAGVDAAHFRHRDAGGGDRAVRRQDRHPDPKPDGSGADHGR